jgi:hypothetical protein
MTLAVTLAVAMGMFPGSQPVFAAQPAVSQPAVSQPAVSQPAVSQPAMAQAEVTLHGETFRVDVADTPSSQAKGLGGRKHLGPSEGMLFLYDAKRRHSFWMKGMFIPIDMIWLDNRRVVYIEHNVPPPPKGTPPQSLPTYQPDAPANIVLEIAAGRAKALGLKVGDRARFRFNLP